MKTNDYIVIKNATDPDEQMFVTKRDNFESVNLCETYDNYGQKVGCYNAGCYAIDNSDSDAEKDFLRDLYDHFGIEYNDDDLAEFDFSDVENGLNELLSGISQEKIDSFIKEWKEKNEIHTEAIAWTYWDGHNFRSLVMRSDLGEPDVEEIDDDEEEAILAELPGFPYIEGTTASIETENYIFTFTLWADDPFYCTVEKK
jgi:hypothetical protein